VVAAGLASRCEVQIAYAIGKAKPLSVNVETFGTGVLEDDKIAAAITRVFDLRPRAIIHQLDLLRPIYRKLAAYGHLDGTTWT
jgi:S-adenosylmethionine synthetase